MTMVQPVTRGQVNTDSILTPTDAQQILGDKFMSVEEVCNLLGMQLNKHDKQALTELRTPSGRPITEGKLSSGPFILFPLLPVTLTELCESLGMGVFPNRNWFMFQPFAETRAKVGWILLRSKPIPYSSNKIWDRQIAMLPQDEEVSSALSLMFGILCYSCLRGRRLFRKGCVRTTSFEDNIYRIHVGPFDIEKLWINGYWGDMKALQTYITSQLK